MDRLIIFLLSLVGHALSFPVTTGGTPHVFYCKIPGCAANVTRVFCNEEILLDNDTIMDCSGKPPPPNTVCQRDRRAYVSTSTSGRCEFEGDVYIETEKCADLNGTCDFTAATTLQATTQSPVTTKDVENVRNHQPMIIFFVVLGVAALLVTIVLAIYCYKRRNRDQSQEQTSSGEAVPLQQVQTSGVSEKDTHTGNGLDDSNSTQCDRNPEHA